MSPVVDLEPWLSWAQLGEHLGGASKRWLEERVREGMPSNIIAGKRCFKVSKAVAWLDQHGHIGEGKAA